MGLEEARAVEPHAWTARIPGIADPRGAGWSPFPLDAIENEIEALPGERFAAVGASPEDAGSRHERRRVPVDPLILDLSVGLETADAHPRKAQLGSAGRQTREVVLVRASPRPLKGHAAVLSDHVVSHDEGGLRDGVEARADGLGDRVAAFDTEADAIALANSGELGLAAYVMSGDRSRAMRVAGALDAGMVGINTGRVSCAAAPFGGVKGSGYGRSGGREGIDEYLETSYVAIAEP